MYDYQHILFPVDFSAQTGPAGQQVAELAQQGNARITLLHVIANFPEDIPNDWIAPEDQPPRQYMLQRCEQALEKLASDMGAVEAERICMITEHSARSAIVEYAREHGVDLIVMGAHGHGHGRIGSLIGSITAGVVGAANQDVLVVRSQPE